MHRSLRKLVPWSLAAITVTTLAACAGGGITPAELAEGSVANGAEADPDTYIIGPGDGLQIFVWGHPDLTTNVTVRPDGNISTPLVEDLPASGSTPTGLARLVEQRLSEYIRTPQVTVIVQNFVGEYARQVRVVGQAAQPQSLAYREGMTLLDVLIAVGGLSEFAAGNRAKLVRQVDGKEQVIRVRLDDLLNQGDLEQNVRIRPGDVLIIPESFF